MARIDGEQRQLLQRGVALFNEGEYFESHEELEALWHQLREPEKTFVKGLIHAAVSLYQYGRGNSHGARVKAASCRRYLEPYLPGYEGLDLAGMLAALERFIAPLHAQPPAAPPPPPTLPPPRLAPAPPTGPGPRAARSPSTTPPPPRDGSPPDPDRS